MPPAFLLRFALILLQTRLVGPIQGIAGTRADPETFFLDELTTSGDEENAAIIESIVGDLKKDGCSLVIMTTHDRDQDARLGLLADQEGGKGRGGQGGIKIVEAGLPYESMLNPFWRNKGFEKEEG
jgi:hypothetical protein